MLLLLIAGGLSHLAFGLDPSVQTNNALAIALYAVVLITVSVTHFQGGQRNTRPPVSLTALDSQKLAAALLAARNRILYCARQVPLLPVVITYDRRGF